MISSGPMSPTSATSSTWKRSVPPACRIGIDPLGGAGVRYWQPIIERYGLNAHHRQRRGRSDLSLHDAGLGRQDPDGLLVALCDGAADRHARQVRRRLRQRHRRRPPWHRDPLGRADEPEPLSRRIDRLSVRATVRNGAATARSARPSSRSAIIDRVAKKLGRRLVETPVGFKWFVDGLCDGSFGFAGEESAGASFLRRDGTVWTTDKDGIILGTAGRRDDGAHQARSEPVVQAKLTDELGVPFYERIDAPATPAQKDLLKRAVARTSSA